MPQSAKNPNGTPSARWWNVHTPPLGRRGSLSADSVRTCQGRASPRSASHSGRSAGVAGSASALGHETQASPAAQGT